jgi:phospholipid/cholesterol/gamma-HCH transport system permease protein
MCLALTVLTDVTGTLGGAFVAEAQLGVSYQAYFDGARGALEGEWFFGVLSRDVYSGLAKSLVFGVLIGVVGCAQGLRATGGALGVGRAVRKAVVASIVLVLVLGYFMTWFFYGI